jgi:hypothetical protein
LRELAAHGSLRIAAGKMGVGLQIDMQREHF